MDIYTYAYAYIYIYMAQCYKETTSQGKKDENSVIRCTKFEQGFQEEDGWMKEWSYVIEEGGRMERREREWDERVEEEDDSISLRSYL